MPTEEEKMIETHNGNNDNIINSSNDDKDNVSNNNSRNYNVCLFDWFLNVLFNN